MMSSVTQPTLAGRIRGWLSWHHFAQIALLLHPMIVVRTGGEYLRLKMAGRADLSALVEPLFIAVAGVGLLAMVTLVLYFLHKERAVVVMTIAGLAGLIAYKLLAMPGLE